MQRHGFDHQRPARPRPPAPVDSSDRIRSGHAEGAESQFLPMGARAVSGTKGLRLADRIRRIQRERLPVGRREELHRLAGSAPPQGVLPGGVSHAAEKARAGIRCEGCVGVIALTPLSGAVPKVHSVPHGLRRGLLSVALRAYTAWAVGYYLSPF